MSKPDLPLGEGNVPDKALEELLAAFATDPPADDVDLDDPSIDLLLGLEPADDSAAVKAPPTESVDMAPADPSAPVQPAPPVDSVDPSGAAPVPPAAPSGDSTGSTSTLDPKDLPTSEQPATPPDADPSAKPVTAPVRKPIRIGGDDLPDTLYLDEEGEERLRGTSATTEASIREERTTILIGDDEIEGSSGGIPIGTGASMDPRLRARRIAVKRAVSRRRLKWILIPTVLIVVIASALAVLGSSLFAVRSSQITVSGAQNIDPNDLQGVLDDLSGTPVLLVDTRALEQRLEKSPWVSEARVTTDFHGASVEILERKPLATYLGPDGKYRIIDVNGVVVDVLDGQPIEFMLVTGPGVNAAAGGSAGAAFTHAAELVEALTPGVRSRTASVAVSDTGELSLVLHNEPETVITLGAPTQLLDKLTRLEALLKNTDVDKCTKIDVSTAELGPTCST